MLCWLELSTEINLNSSIDKLICAFIFCGEKEQQKGLSMHFNTLVICSISYSFSKKLKSDIMSSNYECKIKNESKCKQTLSAVNWRI
jgi:hypothetical protein